MNNCYLCKSGNYIPASASKRSLQKRFIDSKNAKLEDFPYIVYIESAFKDDSDKLEANGCSGSIINKWYVVTAAHCVFKSKLKPVEINVRAGSLYRLYEGSEHSVECCKIHDKYDEKTLDNDIAALKLREPIVLDGNPTRPIDLIHPGDISSSSFFTPAKSASWGCYSENLMKTPTERLRRVRLHVVNTKKCDECYKQKLGSGRICAAKDTDFQGCAALGDSGSPLVVGDRLAGIAISAHANRGCPDIYIDVLHHYYWIKRNTKYIKVD